jgi:hypothetical protein
MCSLKSSHTALANRDAHTGDIISSTQAPPVPWPVSSLVPSPSGSCVFICGSSTAAAALALPSLKLLHTFRHAVSHSHIHI